MTAGTDFRELCTATRILDKQFSLERIERLSVDQLNILIIRLVGLTKYLEGKLEEKQECNP